MSEKLLPCPFCGGEARLEHYPYSDDSDAWYAVCTKCGANLEHQSPCGSPPDQEAAIAAWNERAPSERQAIVDWLLSMKRDDTNWPQHLAKRIERGEHLEAPSHE